MKHLVHKCVVLVAYSGEAAIFRTWKNYVFKFCMRCMLLRMLGQQRKEQKICHIIRNRNIEDTVCTCIMSIILWNVKTCLKRNGNDLIVLFATLATN